MYDRKTRKPILDRWGLITMQISWGIALLIAWRLGWLISG